MFAGRVEIPDQLVQTGWYLHAIASSGSDQLDWSRRSRAFRISAHILELASRTPSRPNPERLELAFGAALGYRRGGLDPNASAVYSAALPILETANHANVTWRGTVAVEAAIYLLSFRTSDTFEWLAGRRAGFSALRQQTQLDDLAGTIFGPSEHVVEACYGFLRFLIFGDRPPFEAARARLFRLFGSTAEAATVNERWVAAHLLVLSDELDVSSPWTCLPPDFPAAARRALTSTSPPVLTLWEPQRELLAAGGAGTQLLSPETRRAILSIPTSAGKTLIAQMLVLAELARSEQSVCLIAPQRSLVREIRRALLPRVRALRKRMSADLPDFLADFAADVLDEQPPDVQVVTPERFAAMLRGDPEGVLDRFGLFVFDEAHLVGDTGRGFTLEGALTYLNWRTRDTHHRIVLMSAVIGNEATFQSWLETDQPVLRFRSSWRGPRRLSAAFTTHADWDQQEDRPPAGRVRIHRVACPLYGIISFKVPGAAARSFTTTEPIGTLVCRTRPDGRAGPKDTGSTPHYVHVAALASFLEHAGPVLTVTRTRPDAQRLAAALAEGRDPVAGTRRTRDAVAAILDASHPLVAMLERGVGYHHAGLPLDVLALVEDELRAGRLDHLVCTTTLTEGVNLPVHTVVLAETQWTGSDVHLSGPRMLNALGRAGRAGIETEGWVVFAPSGIAPSDPEQHLPDPDSLRVRSMLSSEELLEQLEEFEARRATAADAVFSELPVGLEDFTSFVWYVLACEEALGNALSDEGLDDVVAALFAARQLTDSQLTMLKRFASDVRTTYVDTDVTQRRAWARSGARIASARRIDELAASLVERTRETYGLAERRTLAAYARAERELAAGSSAIDLLEECGVLEAILELPDVSKDSWRFRVTERGDDVDVDVAEVMKRWIAGQPLSEMADETLMAVPRSAWRLEQMVDAVSRGFGHSISWMIAAVIERANASLTVGGHPPICPALPLYVRFGVDSPTALRLVTRMLRNRQVAVRVARAAAGAEVEGDAVDAWLAEVPVESWPQLFGAGPSDILELLDITSDPQAEVLRRLLEGEAVEVSLDDAVELGPVRLVVAPDASGVPLVSVEPMAGGDATILGSQWQADLRNVLATGVEISAAATDGPAVLLRRTDAQAPSGES